MLENIRVGLPFIADQNESEVTLKLEALTKAVSSLARNERPQLYLVVTEEALTAISLLPPYISLFDGIIHIGENSKKAATTFGSLPIQTTSNNQLFEKIDFYLTVSPDVLTHPCSAVLIPDFQHHNFSRFFLPQEQAWQDVEIKRIAEQASMIVFTRHSSEQSFLKAYPSAKGATKVISTPFYPENEWYDGDPLAVQHKYGLPDNFVLCSNHFWLHKNHPVLFKAIALLRRRGQDIHLVCTGLTSDPQRPSYFLELQQYIDMIGITDLIHILGPIPRRDNIQLIRRSLFVVQPSLCEGLVTTIQECRALAKPIIISNLALHLEQSYGTYFQGTSAEDLAQKISGLLPISQPGPDLCQESEAKQASANLVKYLAREFCDIVREAQIKFNKTMVSAPTSQLVPDVQQQAEAKQESTHWAKRYFNNFCSIVKKKPMIFNKNQPSQACSDEIVTAVTPLAPGNLGIKQQPSPSSTNEIITIATSLAPRDLDNQRQAINSWQNLGFRVVSINAPEEMTLLRPYFTDIEFVLAERDARNKYGKPYVYLDDFLAYLKKQDSRICGIINSDIHLFKDNFQSIVYNEAKDALVYGARVNIDSLTNRQGTMDPSGFDYFFFDKKIIPYFPPEEFCIGLPVWDYWVPLVAAACKVPVKKIITPVAYHVKHPLRWDWRRCASFALTLAKYVPPPADHYLSGHSLSFTDLHFLGKLWREIISKHSIEIMIEP